MPALARSVATSSAAVADRKADVVHHVVAVRGVGHTDPEAYQSVHSALAPSAAVAGLAVHAWALVPEQLQLCVSGRQPLQGLALFFAELEARLAECGGAAGPAVVSWRAVPVAVDTHLFVSQLYIERLPVQRGLAVWPWAWRWSSHAANAAGVHDACVRPHAAYLHLGIDTASRLRAYRALFELDLDPCLWDDTTRRLEQGEALGQITSEQRA
jgi:putative transposase